MNQDVLTAEEAAEYLRMNERTLRYHAQRREIPGRRIGTQWRFHREVLERWIKGDTLPPPQRPPQEER